MPELTIGDVIAMKCEQLERLLQCNLSPSDADKVTKSLCKLSGAVEQWKSANG